MHTINSNHTNQSTQSTRHATPKNLTLVHLLQSRATELQNAFGYHFLDDTDATEKVLGYAQLDFQARLIAAHLQSLKLQGKRALLLFPAGLDYVAAFFGCLYAGVTAVPVYPPHRNRPDLRLQAILQDAQPDIVLAPSETVAERDTLAKHNPDLNKLFWLATDALDNQANTYWREPEINGDTLAFLQYTSGSTGSPKGVMLSHGNLMHNMAQSRSAFGLTPKDKCVTWLPPFHDMGLIGGILQPLYTGIDVTLMSPTSFLQKPVRWLDAITKTRATSSGGPNFAYDLCVRKITPEQRTGLDLSSWDVALCGAEPVREETLNRFAEMFAPHGFRKEAFIPCYGLAEATLLVSGGPRLQPLRVHALPTQPRNHSTTQPTQPSSSVSCGLPAIEQTIEIVHPETHTRCAADEVGEVWVQGQNMAQGYWNRPEETEKTFRATLTDDPGAGLFMRTGDLGFIKEGCLCITGRLKDLIIIRGLNHYPQDIEATVADCHPTLQGSFNAAFSIDVAGEEQLVVISELDRTQLRKLDMSDLVDTVRGAVSTHHALQLHALCVLRPGSLPKTTSGKVQRRATKAAYLEDALGAVSVWHVEEARSGASPDAPQRGAASPDAPRLDVGFTPTAAAIQKWMTNWLAAKMKMPAHAIEPHKPFAEYGLDSMTAVELAHALTEWLKPAKELKPTLAWDYPTLAQLSAHLAQAPNASSHEQASAPVTTQLDDDLSAALAHELAQLERLLAA